MKPKPTGQPVMPVAAPTPTSPVVGAHALPGPSLAGHGQMAGPEHLAGNVQGAGRHPFYGYPNLWAGADASAPAEAGKEIRAFYGETLVVPAAAWETNPANFEPDTPDDVVAQYIWEGPLLDLRKDLKGSFGNGLHEATTIGRAGSYGSGVKMTMLARIEGINIPDYPETLRVFSREALSPFDSRDIQTVTEWQEISTDWWSGGAAVNLTWSPPGAPIRFWRVYLRLDQASGTAPADTPLLRLQPNAQ
jgi:hypothetical protein